MKPFKIQFGGRDYNATWHIEGKDLLVSSAYGSKRAPVGRSDPEALAKRLLSAMIRERIGG